MQGGGFMERRHSELSSECPKLKRNYKDHFLWNLKKTSFGNIKYFHNTVSSAEIKGIILKSQLTIPVFFSYSISLTPVGRS